MSDHNPLILGSEQVKITRRVPFKFYNMWVQSADFLAIVKDVWDTEVYGSSMFRVVTKLKALKKPLRALNKSQFGQIRQQTAAAQSALFHIQTQLQQDPQNLVLQAQEGEAIRVHKRLLQAECSFMQHQVKEN